MAALNQYTGDLLRDLALLNPWWTDATTLARPPGEIRRWQVSRVVAHLSDARDPRAALLIGPRRVGKTTLARQVLDHFHRGPPRIPARNLVYVDFQERLFGGPGPTEILNAVAPGADLASPIIIVLDEIQFVAEWDKALRQTIQAQTSRRVRILATGSGSAELRRATGDTLLDRVEAFQLGSLVFPEFLDLVGTKPDRPRPELETHFRAFLARGGYPELAALTTASDVWRRLRAICERYVLDGDVVRRLRIRQSETLGRLWLHLVRNPGQILNPIQLGNETGTKRDTAESWIGALRQAELIVAVEPSQTDGWPAFGKNRHPRAYPSDHGLCVAYGLPAHEGAALETLVLRHLRDFSYRMELEHGKRAVITTWREDAANAPGEVDFRLKSDGFSLLIEVKGTEAPTSNQVVRLAVVARRLGHADAILVHGGSRRESVTRDDVRVHLWPVLDFTLALPAALPFPERTFHA